MKKILFLITYIILACSCNSPDNNNQNMLKQSYFKLTTSNGLIVSVYNAKTNRIDYVYPHIFAHIDSANYVYPFVGNITLKSEESPASTCYLKNTHVIESRYKDFTIYYTASFNRLDKVFYIVARGEKEKIMNLSFEAEDTPGDTVSGIDHLENHLQDLPCRIAGNVITGTHTKHYKDNIFEKYFLYSFTDPLHTDKQVVEKAIQQLQESKVSLIDEEVEFMRKIIDSCKIPSSLSKKELNTLEQAVSILKMAQVSDKEIFPYSHGQIMASLRPGLWHLMWVRDGSFAIQAMTRLGMYAEARKGLEFMLRAPSNHYKNYIYKDGKDYGPGVDYQISLTRYFGNGTEECDINDHGPNIEYDNFGLFLSTFIDYVTRSGDWDFYSQWNEVVTTKVADAIINSMDTNNLIKADSGPWEHHLEKPKQYTFTSGVCARGLEALAETQKKRNLPFEKYEKAASEIKQAILNNMAVDGRYIKGNANDMNIKDHEYWDGGSFEVFSSGLINDKSLFQSHMEAYNKTMAIQGERPGYIRLESADPYENQEWVFINLRIAYAHLIFDNKQAAYPLLNHITEQASLNYNTIPEMFSNKIQREKVTPDYYPIEVWCNCIRDDDNLYIGMIPMVGYGSGTYAITLLTYYGY